jgi:protein gp37
MSTGIAWTDATWNPVTGCSHVSEGCRHCYAEELSLRHKWSTRAWTAINAQENIILHPERLEKPLHWKKPKMIFVNSMSDLFHELVPDEFIERVFAVMAQAGQHTYQVLTKRPKRMMEWCEQHYPMSLPNVWLGTSVENQRAVDERLPYIKNTRAAVRFLSCEPLLEDIDLRLWENLADPGIDWVICGGESGPKFRPMDLAWARSLRDQCIDAGIPFFFKQGSGRFPGQNTELDGCTWQEFPLAQEPSEEERIEARAQHWQERKAIEADYIQLW